jgi:hypothetical protein
MNQPKGIIMSDALSKQEEEFLKLHIASTFRRRPKWIVYNPEFPNKLLFTSIECDGIFDYKPTINDVVHTVYFKDRKIMDLFRKVYGKYIDMQKIFFMHQPMSMILLTSKNHTEDFIIQNTEKSVLITKLKVKEPEPEEFVHIVDDLTYLHLIEVADSFDKFTEPGKSSSFSCPLNISAHELDEPSRLQINTPLGTVNLVFLDGHSTVSVKEYSKKIKETYTATIHLGKELGVTRNVICYDNKYMTVKSLIPASIQFIRK